MARLDQICKLNMGQSPDSSSYNENKIGMPFFQGNADFGTLHPTVRIWCSAPTKVANPGDILISVRAPIGALNIANVECCIGRGLAALTVDERKCKKEYLWHAISSKVDELNSKGTGSTFKAISKNILAETEIPLPNLDMQTHIAAVLDEIDNLISFRKQQLARLDKLVKARFVELFGDPVINPMKWDCSSVIDECKCMVPGRDKPKSFTGHIPWITIEDLNVNGTTYESKSGLGLTQGEIDEVNRKAIPTGSVIMSCVGNLGICSIAGKEMIINQQLHSFQCGERINNVFLMNYLGYRKDYMNKWASNTTVLYMNKSICNSIPIIVPPMELQEKFASFFKKTDKSKLAIQQSLDKLELLKKALMQKCFG